MISPGARTMTEGRRKVESMFLVNAESSPAGLLEQTPALECRAAPRAVWGGGDSRALWARLLSNCSFSAAASGSRNLVAWSGVLRPAARGSGGRHGEIGVSGLRLISWRRSFVELVAMLCIAGLCAQARSASGGWAQGRTFSVRPGSGFLTR